jgi:hypothetical protein
MVFIAISMAALAALWVVVGGLRRRRTSWPTVLTVGLALGILRAVLVTWGWYTVEHTGGPLQIPAYLLSILALPEVVLLPRQAGHLATPPEFYTRLALLMVGSTASAFAIVAAIARRLP